MSSSKLSATLLQQPVRGVHVGVETPVGNFLGSDRGCSRIARRAGVNISASARHVYAAYAIGLAKRVYAATFRLSRHFAARSLESRGLGVADPGREDFELNRGGGRVRWPPGATRWEVGHPEVGTPAQAVRSTRAGTRCVGDTNRRRPAAGAGGSGSLFRVDKERLCRSNPPRGTTELDCGDIIIANCDPRLPRDGILVADHLRTTVNRVPEKRLGPSLSSIEATNPTVPGALACADSCVARRAVTGSTRKWIKPLPRERHPSGMTIEETRTARSCSSAFPSAGKPAKAKKRAKTIPRKYGSPIMTAPPRASIVR
jgi:hypothetical protein